MLLFLLVFAAKTDGAFRNQNALLVEPSPDAPRKPGFFNRPWSFRIRMQNSSQGHTDPEEAAFEMLQWNPYSLPNEFDWELAALGAYTKLQRERSDTAIDAVEQEIKRERDRRHKQARDGKPGALSELEAFHELERIGVLTESDFYSPGQASEHWYTDALEIHQERTNARKEQRIKRSEQKSERSAGRIQQVRPTPGRECSADQRTRQSNRWSP